ncbi:helicase-related protein [Yinghuangia aomiensis]
MTAPRLTVQPKDKVYVTAAIAARRGRTMVFVRTKFGADRVAAQLREAGVHAEALHGGMTQGARTRTLAEFKEGQTPVLVATDVAARGIHVDGIDLVLHVDPAGDPKDYLHRAGRTARAGEAGAVVTLALPHQRRSIDRLLEAAGVEPERIRVTGSGDPEMRRITGARTLSEVKAQSVADAAVAAEEEAGASRRADHRAEGQGCGAAPQGRGTRRVGEARGGGGEVPSRRASVRTTAGTGATAGTVVSVAVDRVASVRTTAATAVSVPTTGTAASAAPTAATATTAARAATTALSYGERTYGGDRPRREGGFRDGGRPAGRRRRLQPRPARGRRLPRPAFGPGRPSGVRRPPARGPAAQRPPVQRPALQRPAARGASVVRRAFLRRALVRPRPAPRPARRPAAPRGRPQAALEELTADG